jgi:hypothetical protein
MKTERVQYMRGILIVLLVLALVLPVQADKLDKIITNLTTVDDLLDTEVGAIRDSLEDANDILQGINTFNGNMLGWQWSAWDTMSVSLATAGAFDDVGDNELFDIEGTGGKCEIEMAIYVVLTATSTSSDSFQITDPANAVFASWMTTQAVTGTYLSRANGAVRVDMNGNWLRFMATDEINLTVTDHALTDGTLLFIYRYRVVPFAAGTTVVSDGDGS